MNNYLNRKSNESFYNNEFILLPYITNASFSSIINDYKCYIK